MLLIFLELFVFDRSEFCSKFLVRSHFTDVIEQGALSLMVVVVLERRLNGIVSLMFVG